METRYRIEEVPGGWTVLDYSKTPPESIVGVDTKSAAEFMSRIANTQNDEYLKLKEKYEELEKNFKGLKFVYNEQNQEYTDKLKQAEEFANQATEISSNLIAKIMEILGWDHPKLPFPDSIFEEIKDLKQSAKIAKILLNEKN